ncbi:MAG: hypothetical protein JJU11_06895, partial [Candidatus Sumerlaeia bacterium]|nr:hypothetical protein [Candidatus Sumerlaeia bacterium]
LEIDSHPENEAYLEAKVSKMGHLLNVRRGALVDSPGISATLPPPPPPGVKPCYPARIIGPETNP